MRKAWSAVLKAFVIFTKRAAKYQYYQHKI